MFPPLPPDRFAILLADAPWDYKGQTQHNGKGGKSSGGATNHYPTVTIDDLKRLDVPSITADNALLFLWVTNPHLDQGIDLMKSWGFAYATVAFTWDKERVNPGFYTMSQVELCLVGRHGKIPTPRGSRNERQYVRSRRQAHSQKPEEVARRIERMFPTQSKVELFARRTRPGWTTWGNQVEDIKPLFG